MIVTLIDVPSYQGLIDLVGEIKKCEHTGATIGALCLSFVCIDAMSYLAMPAGKAKQGRSDFIAWTNEYLKAHPNQPYQYRGIDVYAARCGLLHAFSAEADLHRADRSIYQFGYHDGGEHRVDDTHTPKFVLIGTAALFNDLAIAVRDFLAALGSDSELRARVESRLPLVYETVPLMIDRGRGWSEIQREIS